MNVTAPIRVSSKFPLTANLIYLRMADAAVPNRQKITEHAAPINLISIESRNLYPARETTFARTGEIYREEETGDARFSLSLQHYLE